ncbi:hypothetical protein F5884DRAFT_905138 [Xylogone sp. PMI_703]|nr:hypothetical protein F5884DRAFT_905138 [Xylogone sp. PMI_703]
MPEPVTAVAVESLTYGRREENKACRELPKEVLSRPLGSSWDSNEYCLLQYHLEEKALSQFLILRRFYDSYQQVVITRLDHAASELKDSFLAFSGLFASNRGVCLTGADLETCFQRAAASIVKLRSLKIVDRESLEICLNLGVAIATFSQQLGGPETRIICQYVLSLVKRFQRLYYPFSSSEISFILCLASKEMTECLFQGAEPTLRLQFFDQESFIDRYHGVSYSLFPLLYDICVINSSLSKAHISDTSKVKQLHTSMEQLESAIQDWCPSFPNNFPGSFTHKEVTHLLTQAQVFRSLLLLILFRLRHPFGTNNSHALDLARGILNQLSLARQITQESVQCAHMSIAVACFEMVDETERMLALDNIYSLLDYSNELQWITIHLVQRFWTMIDYQESYCWYNFPASLKETMVES